MKWNVWPRFARLRQHLAICSLLLLLVANVVSQSPPQDSKTPTGASREAGEAPKQPSPNNGGVLRVTTRMVVVDVVAVDKKGQKVNDLEASDFSLREDGREQPISTFNFQHPSASARLERDLDPLPPNMFRNLPKYQPSGALNVILIDALNSTLPHQAYVRAEMVRFLEKLPQGQPIAIYALGRKLRLLQDFTTDLSELKKVINAFRGQSSPVLANSSGSPDTPIVKGWAEQLLQLYAPQLLKQIDNFTQENLADQTGMRVQLTLSALNALARTLAGYPGRKNLIWISESIPMMIVPDAKRMPSRESRDFTDQLAMTANLLTDAQIAVYPIDARGLVGSAFYDAANNLSGQSAMGGLATRAEGALAEELLEAHSSMEDLASKTGGKAFFNHNDVAAAVRNDMEDGATYYSLGYYPVNKDWNGQFRKIQIASKRPGVKLRYRLGYFAVDRVEFLKHHPQQRDIELNLALNPDSPEATALQFQTTVVMPSAENGNHIQLNYAVDPQQISFTREGDGLEHAEVDCAARIFNSRDLDKSLKTLAVRMQAGLEEDAYNRINRSFFPCQLTFDLDAGTYFLRLAVRDNATGHIGAVNAHVTVPAPPESADKAANPNH
jgi:VWFA-related protein